ncbi:MAG: FAD:protein FMN transferase [Desulfobacterales bacterium]|nr:FAD:protein FMN transferase [Desulfobacterales bacterium]
MVKTFRNFIITYRLALLAMVLCLGVLFYVLHRAPFSKAAETKHSKKTASQGKKDIPAVREISENWFESRESIYFDIPARILIKHPKNKNNVREIINTGWEEFERIGKIFNPYDPDSEVAAINQTASSGNIRVSGDMYEALKISKNLFIKSQGHFDPTFLSIKELWRHAEETQNIPSEREILKALGHTGFEDVLIDTGRSGNIGLNNPDIRFDFGGIAKGYAVDRVRSVLKESGVSRGLVQLGGEIAAFGKNNEDPWRIGIQHPQNMQDVWGIIAHEGGIRVSTSGNYRQPIVIRGHKFYHIFSPKTGKPVSEKVLGVTTIGIEKSHSNALIDGAATAITVMGTADGLQFARKLGIEALILTRDRDKEIGEHMTPGFKKFYERQ